MNWTQVYDPLGHWWLSTLVAALPIIVLFGLLAGLRVKPHWCAISGALTAIVVAILVFKMPLALAAMSFGYGVAFGLLKIAWIVLAAVYLYDISVETGQFEIMKESVAGITADRRLQVLLVAFCFGAFIEGAAGFGAPVAIAGAFALTQFFWSNYVDSNLVDIAGGVVSMVATVVFLRFWKPKKIFRFDYEKDAKPLPPPTAEVTDQFGGKWTPEEFDGLVKVRSYPAAQVLKAWMPFAILSLFVLLWGLPKIKLAINQATTPAFKVVLPDGKVRPGPPGWNVP